MKQRIVLKLSGEALAGGRTVGFDEGVVRGIARQVRTLLGRGMQVGVVVGGGNFWRGRSGNEIDRTRSDQIGMLATVMNCIYVAEIFRGEGMKTQIFTPFICSSFTELFAKDRVNECFVDGKVVFFAGGTGHPYFSTDSGAVLRAVEIEAEAVLMAKAVDGVYDSDPKINPNARKFDKLTYDEIITNELKAIDLTAATLAKENGNGMEILVFNLNEANSIVKTVNGEFTGTRISA